MTFSVLTRLRQKRKTANIDQGICKVFCNLVELSPSCGEEHEAWHVEWIQAAVTRGEYLKEKEGKR